MKLLNLCDSHQSVLTVVFWVLACVLLSPSAPGQSSPREQTPFHAQVRSYSGGKELAHERYLRVISEEVSPVQQLYIKTKDGLHVAAALRKPQGQGPFPTLVYFHGAPGGQGMERLVAWSLGTTGSPVWERFLQEGYVVVVADYRDLPRWQGPGSFNDRLTLVDDGVSIVDHMADLPYVDPSRIYAYGVSLGADLVLGLVSKTTKVRKAIAGAPGPMSFLGLTFPVTTDLGTRWQGATVDTEVARKNIAPIQCPILIITGTADPLIPITNPLYKLLAEAGKVVQMDVYENGYHDFCIGPQGYPGSHQPLLEGTLASLERTLEFLRATP